MKKYVELFNFNVERKAKGNDMTTLKSPTFWPRCGFTSYMFLYWEDPKVLTQPPVRFGWRRFSDEERSEVFEICEGLRMSGAGNLLEISKEVLSWGARQSKFSICGANNFELWIPLSCVRFLVFFTPRNIFDLLKIRIR